MTDAHCPRTKRNLSTLGALLIVTASLLVLVAMSFWLMPGNSGSEKPSIYYTFGHHWNLDVIATLAAILAVVIGVIGWKLRVSK